MMGTIISMGDRKDALISMGDRKDALISMGNRKDALFKLFDMYPEMYTIKSITVNIKAKRLFEEFYGDVKDAGYFTIELCHEDNTLTIHLTEKGKAAYDLYKL